MLTLEVTLDVFERQFERLGRSDSFSTEGLRALYRYLDGLSDDVGGP